MPPGNLFFTVVRSELGRLSPTLFPDRAAVGFHRRPLW